MIKEHAPVKDWARACAISRTPHELRRRIVAAEVRSCLGNYERIPTEQLQLEKWGDCHSLFFNLQQLRKAGRLTSNQIKQMSDASRSLPKLHCLHIIGRDQQPLVWKTIESVLIELLAKHVQVLTLQVAKLIKPLDMPSLQHLLLDLDTAPNSSGAWSYHDDLFPAISHLKGLKTLYVQSLRKTVYAGNSCGHSSPEISLHDCVNLQHVVFQGVRFVNGVSVPAGCSLHVICMPSHVSDVTRGCGPMLTGLILRHSSPLTSNPRDYWSYTELLPCHGFGNLTSLRLALKKDQLRTNCREREMLQLNFPASCGPLEALEIDVECDLAVFIDLNYTLKSLVVIASGSLTFHESPLELDPFNPRWQCSKFCQPPSKLTTLRHMYLRSGKRLSDEYWAVLATSELCKQLDETLVSPFVKEQQHGWTVRMPADFHPSSLHECCCHACPECLARAGVPLLCSQAWTRDVRPICNGAP